MLIQLALPECGCNSADDVIMLQYAGGVVSGFC